MQKSRGRVIRCGFFQMPLGFGLLSPLRGRCPLSLLRSFFLRLIRRYAPVRMHDWECLDRSGAGLGPPAEYCDGEVNMRRAFVYSAFFLGMFCVVASPAIADLTATVRVSDSFGDAHGAGHGGEFRAEHSGFSFAPASLGEVAGQFEVFCVEMNEYVGFGTTYFADFNTAAVNGGVGGGSPDPLGTKTAYIYNEFVTHNLEGYDYDDIGPGRVESANALQNVIWFFEDELDDYLSGLRPAEVLLAEQFYNDANESDWMDIGAVQIMNLYANADGTGHIQDQLVMSTVPVPGAFLLGVLGLGIAGGCLRRW